LREGLTRTIDYFEKLLTDGRAKAVVEETV